MIRTSILIDDDSAIATLTPDTLAGMQKAAMKQAILERYSYRAKPLAQPLAAPAKVRSPYWQPVDEEC